MLHPWHTSVISSVLVVLCHLTQSGATNITVEDNDPQVVYTPASAWKINTQVAVGNATIYQGGTATISNIEGASYSFTFSGTHIWLYEDSNPGHGIFGVRIDDQVYPNSSSATIAQTPQAVLFFDAEVMPTMEHKVTVTNFDPMGRYVGLDYFVYAYEAVVTSPSATTSTPSPSVQPSTIVKTTSTATIALAAVISFLGVTLLGLLIVLLVRRVRSRRAAYGEPHLPVAPRDFEEPRTTTMHSPGVSFSSTSQTPGIPVLQSMRIDPYYMPNSPPATAPSPASSQRQKQLFKDAIQSDYPQQAQATAWQPPAYSRGHPYGSMG